MKTNTIQLIKVEASEGMTLTNGEIFSKLIYLGCGDSIENWEEITDTEAQQKQDELEAIRKDEETDNINEGE